jgi:L-lactate dehydrogenase complex protein LldF
MSHAKRAEFFLKDRERSAWHDKALWLVRKKRDLAASSLPEWEQLRVLASKIKAHTVSQLPEYLVQFEQAAQKNGIVVHFAKDGLEHNEIVYSILKKNQIKRVVKSKSMLTEECALNPYLEERGLEIIDTDLGERIVQLRHEHPSHIVLPAIHTKREDIAELFHEHLGTDKNNCDPEYLTRAARADLRRRFLNAEAGITGVNFALAESGGIVVCTNEGNADLGTVIPKLHIASMGLEKLIPSAKELAIFLRLLARSATGQLITTYSSHFHGPQGGGEMHIVIVDNGRSRIAGERIFRPALQCIRCGACLNTCPVYRRSGGHSYASTIPGPIGSVISPWQNEKQHSSLPFASTLCGSCTDVCPVKINLHEQLLEWRKKLVQHGQISSDKKILIWLVNMLLKTPGRYFIVNKVARGLAALLPATAYKLALGAWGKEREYPKLAKQSFREQFAKRRKSSHE